MFFANINKKIETIKRIKGFIFFKILSRGICISIEEPKRVKTPNNILFSGMKIIVTTEIIIPHKKTSIPLFSLFFPKAKQKPERNIKDEQILCCQMYADFDINHGMFFSNIYTKSHTR